MSLSLPSPLSPVSSSPPQKVTITILGDGGTGKSSITLRLVRSQWTSTYDPTIEDSYSITRHIDGQTYHISLTDTAGQEEYRGMWATSNLKSDAFLLVYDITNEGSLGVLEEFNTLVDMEADARREAWIGHQGLRNGTQSGRGARKGKARGGEADDDEMRDLYAFIPPVKLVAGNKCDLQESRRISAQKGLEWARTRGCGFMETSARNTVNIEETFALLVRRVVERRREWRAAEERGVGGGRGVDGGLRVDIERVNENTRDGIGFADRRAPTAPLTPLAGGPEKEIYTVDDIREKAARPPWWKRLGRRVRRKLVCWEGR